MVRVTLFVGNRLNDLLMVSATEVVFTDDEIIDVEVFLQVMVFEVVIVIRDARHAAVGITRVVGARGRRHEVEQVDIVVILMRAIAVGCALDADRQQRAAHLRAHGGCVRLQPSAHGSTYHRSYETCDVRVAVETVIVYKDIFTRSYVICNLHQIVALGWAELSQYRTYAESSHCVEGLRVCL